MTDPGSRVVEFNTLVTAVRVYTIQLSDTLISEVGSVGSTARDVILVLSRSLGHVT
jgi:hypothetical protein